MTDRQRANKRRATPYSVAEALRPLCTAPRPPIRGSPSTAVRDRSSTAGDEPDRQPGAFAGRRSCQSWVTPLCRRWKGKQGPPMIRTLQTSEWLREGEMDAGGDRWEGAALGPPPAESSALHTGLALSAHTVASMGADYERRRLT